MSDLIRMEVPQTWTGLTQARSCGTCTACCTWLGIEELHKYTGQKCKHLRGPAYPTKRCGIYPGRPKACAEYQCLWRAGWGPPEMRPHDSGMLITVYNDPENPGKGRATVNVFNGAKAEPLLKEMLGNLVTIPIISEIGVCFLETKRGLMLKGGMIYDVKILPPDGYESLIYAADMDHPVGAYQVVNQ